MKNNITIGFGMTGSFCNFNSSFEVLERLKIEGNDLIPIMSENSCKLDTRFGKAEEHIKRIEELTGKKVINNIVTAEPVGPKNMCDVMIICPCTGNTIAKLVNGINDTCVTMVAKSLLRNGKPIILCISTNDGLSASFENIGKLMNRKNVYIVPFNQDDFINKPYSLTSNFDLIEDTLEKCLNGVQVQPIIAKI